MAFYDRSFTRRRALQIGAAVAGAGTAASVLGAPARATPVHHTLRLGQFEIVVVSDGALTLPLSFLLPSTPRTEAEALLAASGVEPGAQTGQVNVTVIKTSGATIVVDSGGGADFMPTLGRFADNLERAGIPAGSVTHVVFTHAHPDHLWGVIDPFEENTRFPNARHLITGTERDYWLKPGLENEVPEGLQGMAAGTVRRLKLLASRLETVAAGSEILPGLALLDTSGHTPGHASVLLRSGSDTLLIGGDVLTNPVFSFARPDWPWGADIDREKGIATRQRTLDMLAHDKIPLLGYHLPWPGVGRVERKDGAYRLVMY